MGVKPENDKSDQPTADTVNMRPTRNLPLVLLSMIAAGTPVFAESPLYWAITNNDALELWKLTATETLPDTLTEKGLSPSAWAVARGGGEVLEVLTWRGVALDRVDDEGRNLLFGAAALGRLDLFEKIERAGARVDQIDHQGQTLIHAAAHSPHPIVLKMLLSRGLAPRPRSELGVTPLMLACLAGRADEVRLLLAWGAIPEDEDYLGRSVRDYAVAGDDPATLEVIETALLPWTISPGDEDLPPSPE